MENRIACFLDNNEHLGKFSQKGKIVIYASGGDSNWIPERHMFLNLEDIQSITALREKMDQVIDFLGEIKLFIVKSITGIPFFALEKAGFEIWECEGNTKKVLNEISFEQFSQINKCETQELKEQEIFDDTKLVRKISEGVYSISLKEIQGGTHGVTSRQLLLPILKKGKFEKLEIECGHIPSWLELSVLEFKYKIKVEKKSFNEVEVLISKEE